MSQPGDLSLRQRVPTLDGWRAIAVLLVIWHHFTEGFYPNSDAYYARSLSQFGAFGVDIFFAISGFIITKLLADEALSRGRIDFGGFYIRRAFRILPPCYVFLAVVASTTGFKSLRELGGSALFFRNYVPVSMAGPMTGHLWSLAVEEHFYLLWPLLLSFVILRGASKAANLTGWIAIGCGLWRVANAQYSFGTNWLPLVPEHFRTDLRLDALLWGCVAALAIGDPGQAERIRKSFRPWMAWMGAVLCMVCVIFFSQLTSLWLAILIPVVLLGTLQHSEWAVSRMLDHKVVRWVGRISYSLYLWQQIFLIPGWEDRLWFQKGPWNLVATLILACASYWVIEKPCIALGRRLSSRPKRVEIPEPHPVIEAAG